jgi:hypothetical protein
MQTFVTVAGERPSSGAGGVLGASAHDGPVGHESHGPIPTWPDVARRGQVERLSEPEAPVPGPPSSAVAVAPRHFAM